MTATTTIADIPQTTFDPRSRWRRWRSRITLATIAVVLAAAGGYGLNLVVHTCGGLRSGITSIGGECVGITDGAYIFSPELSTIEGKFKTENDWVQTQPSYVNVVLLSPFTATPSSPMSMALIRHSVEGTYTAQYRANHTHDFGDQQPLIRVLLANEGSREDQWQPVVHQIEALANGPHPVVAVVGLGVSVANTQHGAQDLSARHIPMVAAVLSADGLDHDHIPGLIRVTPNNTDYVGALRQYLGTRPDLKTAIIVYDRSEPDLYVTTLRTAIEHGLATYLTNAPQSFFGTAIPSDVTPQLFDGITRNVCSEAPDIVFFAGRSTDLRAFIDSLAGPACGKKQPLTIMVGATGLSSVRQDIQNLRNRNITVIYASSADPAWVNDPNGRPDYYTDFLAAYQQHVGLTPGALDDGYALMHHDALAAAVTAIRLASPATGTPIDVTPANVGSQLLNLNNEYTVPGGSGTLTFSSRRGGNAGNKPVPVVGIPALPDDAPRSHPYTTPIG
jgi:hypothetical protein